MDEFTAATKIDDYLLNRYTERGDRDNVIAMLTEEIEKNLAHKIMQLIPIEGGEIIISLSDVRTEHHIDLMMTEMRQSLRAKPLVRCKDCVKFYTPRCPVEVRKIGSGEFYCAEGVKYVKYKTEVEKLKEEMEND